MTSLLLAIAPLFDEYKSIAILLFKLTWPLQHIICILYYILIVIISATYFKHFNVIYHCLINVLSVFYCYCFITVLSVFYSRFIIYNSQPRILFHCCLQILDWNNLKNDKIHFHCYYCYHHFGSYPLWWIKCGAHKYTH